MNRFVIKCVVACVAVFSLIGLPYVFLGVWNRVFGGWVLVFYCYAGSPKFVQSYGFPGLAQLFRWVPIPIGVLQQEGRWGLVLASAATEDDFVDPAQQAAFLRLQRRIARIAAVTGAAHIHLAGILPSLIGGQSDIQMAETRPQVVAAVTAAVGQVAAEHLPQGARDVIVLGGAGFIGRAVVQDLQEGGWTCHVVDPKRGAVTLPDDLRGRPVLLLDVARKGAIAPLIGQMWPGLVVLNEVFPAPSRRDVVAMQARGVTVLHLAGVRGRVMPPLPHGYEGAVPCCAARPCKGPPDVVIRHFPAAGADVTVDRPGAAMTGQKPSRTQSDLG